MKWYEIVDALNEVRRDIAYAKLKTFRTKGKEKEKWEQEIIELKKKESECMQMKIDYKIDYKM